MFVLLKHLFYNNPKSVKVYVQDCVSHVQKGTSVAEYDKSNPGGIVSQMNWYFLRRGHKSDSGLGVTFNAEQHSSSLIDKLKTEETMF